jgi:uncharacterized protein (TIGR03000 family)
MEGIPSKQMTEVRYYQTRSLARGEVVSYTFRAEMTVGGAVVTDTKQVTLRAGDDAVVKFDKLLSAVASSPSAGSGAETASR